MSLFSRLYEVIESKTGITEESSEDTQSGAGLISVMRKMCADPVLKKALPSFQLPLKVFQDSRGPERVLYTATLELYANEKGDPQFKLRMNCEGEEFYKEDLEELSDFLSYEWAPSKEEIVEGLVSAIENAELKKKK